MKLIIRGVISLTGILMVGHILSKSLDLGINGLVMASGLTLLGFFVGVVFEINILKGRKSE